MFLWKTRGFLISITLTGTEEISMKYMCREFPDEFVVEANSVEEAEEILDCMGCYMQDEEDGTIPCDGPVPVENCRWQKVE